MSAHPSLLAQFPAKVKREGGVYTYVNEGGVRDPRMRIKGVGLAHNYEFKVKHVRAAIVLDLSPPF
jgi:hypothetical protein